jgi:hypothetical protein
VYVLAVVVSFIVVFLYCIYALFVCNVCYLSVVLYYCHRLKAQFQLNKYIYIYIYIYIGACFRVAVTALCYKSESRGFETRRGMT